MCESIIDTFYNKRITKSNKKIYIYRTPKIIPEHYPLKLSFIDSNSNKFTTVLNSDKKGKKIFLY